MYGTWVGLAIGHLRSTNGAHVGIYWFVKNMTTPYVSNVVFISILFKTSTFFMLTLFYRGFTDFPITFPLFDCFIVLLFPVARVFVSTATHGYTHHVVVCEAQCVALRLCVSRVYAVARDRCPFCSQCWPIASGLLATHSK